MELLQLKYFQTVARLEHMTKAAEELHIAQPSLSKTIARLEKDLGVPLFDRQGRQITLNSFGKVFLKRVERIFHELSEGEREIKDLAELQQSSITLAVSIPRILPELLGSFLLEHPNVRFQQFLASTPSMKRQLDNIEIDFCISSVPIEGEEIIWEPLITEEIFLVVPSGHRLSGRESIHLHEVKDEPFISMNTGYGFRHLTDKFCKEAGFTPHIAFEVDEPTVISDLIKQGLGIAFVPSLTLLKNSTLALNKLRIIEPNCERTIGLSWSKKRYLSKTAQQFREFVIDYFSNIRT
ncbi:MULTISPECIES: LysR family transcriptional regulator [Bacillus]|uniref:LysR family transcriptional regulator n=1 Tax=Bacillus TaxID=1386 RepID=UPI0001A11F9B|nr:MULTISPECIES: LysR family transcriptional regulator [Bacillus]AYF09140.1 LysR family transcriptional regulator [Bacillus mobilis]EEL79531.1 Transcriptional regulator, LysR [Bacillus cereus AH1271]PEU83726.1 LysR family transcriptional regulator [Bacillus cereus]BCD32217.1 LysR family transcriptional regulator [Bacillus cereus]HDX9571701.1 LysR family transcriptional regulator [Bacillus mobilis]